jgi:hypothetical protein
MARSTPTFREVVRLVKAEHPDLFTTKTKTRRTLAECKREYLKRTRGRR